MRGLTASIGQNSMLGIKWLVFLLLFVSLFWAVGNVRAQDFSWTSSPPSVAKKVAATTEPWNCEFPQKVTVAGETALQNTCITSGGGLRFGMTDYGMPVVSLGYDQKMYKLLGFCGGYKNCMYLPHTDTLIAMQTRNNAYHRVLKVYKNFSYNLQKRTNELGTAIEYVPKTYQANYTFTESLANPVPIGWAYDSFGVSENEKWLVFEPRNRGMFRLDLENFSIKRFSSHSYSYNSGSLTPWTHFSVSNDGQQVVMSGYNTDIMAFSISDDCGDSPTDQQIEDIQYLANECPKTYLRPIMSESITGFKYGVNAEFSQDQAGELRVYAVGQYPSDNAWVTLRAAGYQPNQSQLDYLALGDSYSSGEGDTDKQPDGHTYYLPLTNDAGGDGLPEEKCHISTRSYPFKLRAHFGIDEDSMQSVACSGAKSTDITYKTNYYGQSDRLKILDANTRLQWQGDAIVDFVPGRVEQIRFVKKYQPKAITLTAGGNDVGFGEKIKKCAANTDQVDICEYVDNVESRAKLGFEIQNQFYVLKKLYAELRSASPNTKIYVLGYPSFINPDEASICLKDGGHLDAIEKEMIDEAVRYMNSIIQTSAQAEGAEYIDIFDSLEGGRICDIGGSYTTGIADVGYTNSLQQYQAFHPNAAGHQKIAEKVQDFLGIDTLSTYPYEYDPQPSTLVPNPPEYFSSSMDLYPTVNNIKNVQLTLGSEQTKTQAFDISLDDFTFSSGSSVDVSVHSSPTSIGSFISDDVGSLDISVSIPQSVSAGFHTLVVTGESYSGEPIKIYQDILVKGPNAQDIDEDGIEDISDHCLFITPIGIDEDDDGIDDMCDSFIGFDAPYRVRNGNSTNNEKPEHIYIERNVNATNITNISGDYDPDGDGWAIVAQSTKQSNFGTPASFWIDENNVPHVSIRTADKGCVQLTPRSLKLVKQNKLRKFKQEAKNTNTCRSESDSADTDNNGIADNQQPLYRARNGLSTNNEDPTSIYLERSSVAAEAQLGLSDYPHSNSWNLLAASKPDTTKEIFVKMVMITNQDGTSIPTILANQIKTNPKGNTTTTCIALQPQNTTTITTNNQHRTLKKVTLPEGEGCE